MQPRSPASIGTRLLFAPRRLERLATPLVSGVVATQPGDVVRLAHEADGFWFYCRVEDRLHDGSLVCSVLEAQSWPSLLIDGIVPGVRYVVAPDCVLSVVRRGADA